jgi:hypothetical protein
MSRRQGGGGGTSSSRCTLCVRDLNNDYYDDHDVKGFPGHPSQPKKVSKKTSSSSSPSDSPILTAWTEKCILTVCRLLKIPSTHPCQKFLTEASYCSECLQLIRDIELCVRNLDTFQMQVLHHREELFKKLAVRFQDEDVSSYKDTKGSKAGMSFDELGERMNAGRFRNARAEEVMLTIFESNIII